MTAARLAQRAEDAGLHWDRSLRPPRLRWGPNPAIPAGGLPAPHQPHPATAPYLSFAGGVAPPAPLPIHCDDRLWAHAFPFGTPIDSWAYCAHPGGHYPLGAGNLIGNGTWRKTCVRVDLGLHPPGVPYEMCRMCLDQIREQAWYRRMERDLTGVSVGRFLGAIIPGNGITLPRLNRLPWDAHSRGQAMDQPIRAWRRFLTHLCRDCEKQERIELHFRLPGGHPTGAPANNLEMLSAQNNLTWPWITCTCRYELFREEFGNTDYCIRHRHIKAGRRHNVLLHTRQQNDQWLRETALKDGRLVRASHQKVTHRRMMKNFRACRCGRDIVPDGRRQRVAMCLGCEDIVSSYKWKF
jgi:hypothetical protein